MSTDIDTIFRPEIQRRPGWQKALPWVIAVVVVGSCHSSRDHLSREHRQVHGQTPLTNKPAKDVSKVPPTVKLEPGRDTVARRFIETRRRAEEPASAYSIVTDEIKAGPVVEVVEDRQHRRHPVSRRRDQVRADEDRLLVSQEAQIEIALLPKAGSGASSRQLFLMDIVKRDGKWLVNSWVPRSSPPVPNGS